MNAKKLKFKPWMHPYVAHYLELAVAERVQRWLAGSLEAALSHKYRGRHLARRARQNSHELVPVELRSNTATRPELKMEVMVQKELNRRYRVVDTALMSSGKRNPSQRAVDYHDRRIQVNIKDGNLYARDETSGLRQVWALDYMFPRTSPLTVTEAKNIVSYFHRLRAPSRAADGQWVRGALPPKPLPREEAIVPLVEGP